MVVNWVDAVLLLILAFIMMRGLKLGFILSILNIIRLILTIIITKTYYHVVCEFITNNPRIYNIFEIVARQIFKIVFSSKRGQEAGALFQLFTDGMIKTSIIVFSIIIIFCLSYALSSFMLRLFSFLSNAPILKQLNRMGGLVFGLIEGLFIIYLLVIVLFPIASMMPQSFIGEGVYNSLIIDYLKNLDLGFDFLGLHHF